MVDGNKLLRGNGSWRPGQKLSKLDPELLLGFLEPACAGTVWEHSLCRRDTACANGMTSGRDWQGPAEMNCCCRLEGPGAPCEGRSRKSTTRPRTAYGKCIEAMDSPLSPGRPAAPDPALHRTTRRRDGARTEDVPTGDGQEDCQGPLQLQCQQECRRDGTLGAKALPTRLL